VVQKRKISSGRRLNSSQRAQQAGPATGLEKRRRETEVGGKPRVSLNKGVLKRIIKRRVRAELKIRKNARHFDRGQERESKDEETFRRGQRTRAEEALKIISRSKTEEKLKSGMGGRKKVVSKCNDKNRKKE